MPSLPPLCHTIVAANATSPSLPPRLSNLTISLLVLGSITPPQTFTPTVRHSATSSLLSYCVCSCRHHLSLFLSDLRSAIPSWLPPPPTAFTSVKSRSL
ncbi:hypothetical protein Acr_00g0064430 [Actinidia rufa]|uniref:Uncharacterized protein n=1 Tax=Actinidia rufa TaxID=165716 RepID=A0A7J0DRI7_9ERIC|nr:hypothetical protein Acr_00g0064430 [Actinidia rufa]